MTPGRIHEPVRPRRAGLRAVLLLLLLAAVPDHMRTPAQPPPTPQKPFNFSAPDAAPLSLNWATLFAAPARLSVTNDTLNEIKLRVEVGKFGNAVSGAEADIAPYLSVSPQPLTLPAGGTLDIKISARPEGEKEKGPLPAGVYSGHILIIDDSTKAFVRRQVQLGVPGFPPPPPPAANIQPAVEKLTVRVWRMWPTPFFSGLVGGGRFSIPLTAGSNPPGAFSSSRPVGILTREAGGTATLLLDESEAAAPASPASAANSPTPTPSSHAAEAPTPAPALDVLVDGLEHAGKYDGQIIFAGSTTNKLALTVYATDIFIWPVITLGFGILLALLSKRYINVSRNIWAFRRQEAELGLRFVEAQREFIRKSRGRPFASYKVWSDFADHRKKLSARIEELRRGSIVTLADVPSETYKMSVADGLKFLSDRVTDWAALASELLALQQELERAYPRVIKVAHAPPGQSAHHRLVEKPAFLSECESCLVGGETKLEALSGLRERVRKATLFANLWGALNARFERCLAAVERSEQELELRGHNLSKEDEKLAAELEGVKGNLENVQTELWTVRDEGSLINFKTDEDLRGAEATLLLLRSKVFATNTGSIVHGDALPGTAVSLADDVIVSNAAAAFSGLSQSLEDTAPPHVVEQEPAPKEAPPDAALTWNEKEAREAGRPVRVEEAAEGPGVAEAGRRDESSGAWSRFAGMFSFLRRNERKDEQTAKKYGAAILGADVLLLLFSFTVALLTGLNSYYIGKAFGTLSDYISLLIWGFGTQVIIDTALAALEKFMPTLSLARTLLRK